MSDIERADSDNVGIIVGRPEDSLKEGVDSVWKTATLHNRNRVEVLLVRNIHRFRCIIQESLAAQQQARYQARKRFTVRRR